MEMLHSTIYNQLEIWRINFCSRVYVVCREKKWTFFLIIFYKIVSFCATFQVGGKAKSLMFSFNDETNFRGFSLRLRWNSFAHVAPLQPDEPDQI